MIGFQYSIQIEASVHGEVSDCFESTASSACTYGCIGSTAVTLICWYRSESSRWWVAPPALWEEMKRWDSRVLSAWRRIRNRLRDLLPKSKDMSLRRSGKGAESVDFFHWPTLPSWKSAKQWMIFGFSSCNSWERLRTRFLSRLHNTNRKRPTHECGGTESNSWTRSGDRRLLWNQDFRNSALRWAFALTPLWSPST